MNQSQLVNRVVQKQEVSEHFPFQRTHRTANMIRGQFATSKKSGNSPSVNTVRSVSTLSTGTLSRTSRKNSIEKEIEFLAPSAHHLKTSLLSYLRENGLGPSTKVHDAKNVLRKATPIRLSTRNKGESKPYIDCIGVHNEDHAGKATYAVLYLDFHLWLHNRCSFELL